jgi:hypothetical protein
MQVSKVLMSNHKSTLLEGKENPINRRQALIIEYKVHHWTESSITPKGNECCTLVKTNYYD